MEKIMKVSLLQENLAKGVGAVSRMVAGKTQLPVLSNILLATDKGKLKLSATNLETGMNLWLGGKVEKQGRITVPARVFGELVNSLPQDTAELVGEGDKLKVRCGKFKATVNGIGAEEFPEVPSLKKGDKKSGRLVLEKQVLESSVGQVALAAGTDEARPIFTGVKMEFKKGGVRLAATDGYRLSVKTIEGVKGIRKEQEMVIPARALVELTKVLGQEEKGEVVLAATDEEKQLILAVDEVEIVTRLLEGDFPDFEKIIPASTSTTIELDKEELQQAVRAAAIFARDSANIVKFRVKGSNLVISANAPQVGENEVELTGKKTGEDGEIAFNSRYLLEMLGVVEAERIQLSMSGALNPGLFKVVGDESWLHIIMPVRVQT
jgi:DNA polymerase-3 subunit beta